MKLVLLVLLAIAGGIGIYRLGGGDPGYVHLFYGGYSIELSVATFALLLFVAALLLYLFIRLVSGMWRAPRGIRSWSQRRSQEKSQENFGRGMLRLIEGDWRKAERLLLSGSGSSRMPTVHYLAAAQAAQELGKTESRDRYLALARETGPSDPLPVALTQARLLQQAGQMEQALAVLENAGGLEASNAQVTAMLVQAYDALGNWEELRTVLPRARSQNALPEQVLSRMEKRSYIEALAVADDSTIEKTWKALPRSYRKNPRSVLMYSRHLVRSGESVLAEKLVRECLSSDWDEDLVRMYGLIETEKPQKELRNAERWLTTHPDSAVLHLTLGRLAAMNGDDTLAREYLEKCVKLGGGSEAYAELGKISERSEDPARALEYYREGLRQPDDPQPTSTLPMSSEHADTRKKETDTRA